MATSLKPRRSKRWMMSPSSRRCSASGLATTSVFSCSAGGAAGHSGALPPPRDTGTVAAGPQAVPAGCTRPPMGTRPIVVPIAVPVPVPIPSHPGAVPPDKLCLSRWRGATKP